MTVRRPWGPSLPARPVADRASAGALARAAACLGVAGLLLAACGGGADQATPAGELPAPLITPSGFEVDPQLLQPLALLGECQDVQPPADPPTVEALPLPPEGFFTSAREQGALLNTQGYVAMTPLQFQVWVRNRTDLEVITAEDEVHESETLISRDGKRIFLKAAAVCQLGSAFIAIVADEVDAEAVPTPSGSPAG